VFSDGEKMAQVKFSSVKDRAKELVLAGWSANAVIDRLVAEFGIKDSKAATAVSEIYGSIKQGKRDNLAAAAAAATLAHVQEELSELLKVVPQDERLSVLRAKSTTARAQLEAAKVAATVGVVETEEFTKEDKLAALASLWKQ